MLRSFLFILFISLYIQNITAENLDIAKPIMVPYATQITANNFHHAIRGSSAVAGIGDWMLSNGTLCASISDPSHETYLSHQGGALVDLGFCERNDDQWNTYHELFNLSREQILSANKITTDSNSQQAQIIVQGKISGVTHSTTYTLNTAYPNELQIETRLTRTAAGDALFLFGALTLHPSRSLSPFVISLNNPEFSKGFQHPFADTNNALAMLKVMTPADLHVLVGAEHIQPEITYGIHAQSVTLTNKKGEKIPLRQFAINDAEFTLLGNFTNALWLDTNGQPGLKQFAQTLFMDLKIGEALASNSRIIVSPKTDVASITDQLYTGELIKGKTDNPKNKILITNNNNHPLTFIKPNPNGHFQARLPKNVTQAQLILNEPYVDSSHTILINTQLNNHQNIDIPSMHPLVPLTLPKNITAQLIFKGRNETPDPIFNPDTLNFSVGDTRYQNDSSTNRLSLVETLVGSTQKKTDVSSPVIYFPPGDYITYATRGPEYSLTKAIFTIKYNQKNILRIKPPQRVIETPHWISADFHVHSELSFDSALPIKQQLYSFVSQGADAIIASEHKRTMDYAPLIKAHNLQGKLISIAGVELTGMSHTKKTPRGMGHSNIFPVLAKTQQFMGGTLAHENRRLGEIIHTYKQQNPHNIFQLNHPRGDFDRDADVNFLNHLSLEKHYNPNLPLDHHNNNSLIEKLTDKNNTLIPYRDIDFDAIELLNGDDMAQYKTVRKDWFSFLKQGYRKTGTANSDSHNAREIVAIPRNYVRVQNDNILNFNQQEFISAIHKGDLIGSTGPIVDITLEGIRMGETFTKKEGILRVEVITANWINVNQLSVYIDGELIHEKNIEGSGVYNVPLQFIPENKFVTVEIKGAAGEDYAAVYPGVFPFAFSNPIFIKN